MQGRRSGRRAGRPDTRGEIAAAAGRLFAERGYDRTSMRAIAAEAGVDPALVTHYFGSKQRLFVETVQLPIDPGPLVALAAAGAAASAGETLARAVVGVLESPPGRERATSIVRAAASEPEAAALLRQQLSEQLFGPVARELGGEEPELRANLCGSQMVGLVMARYVVGVEPLASTEPDRVIRAIAPVLQHSLTGDLDEAF
jgi:AcrR family transcriptional regulator